MFGALREGRDGWEASTAAFWGFLGGASLLIDAVVGLVTSLRFLLAFVLSWLE